jgi:phospholipid-binding lipoprotein MlaA
MKAIKHILILIPIAFLSLPLWSLDSDKINTNSEDFETTYNEDEIYDPLESMNRAIFNFNNVADKIILEPVAKGFKKLPSPIQLGIGNFLNNLKMPLVAVNQLLQGQGGNAAESTGRFIINSTAGLLGLIDVAEKVGLEQKQEDFGQTLATWGVGDGFYIVLPIFGPSNMRDASGMILTSLTDPINAYAITEGEGWVIPTKTATNAVNDRSKIIDELNALRDNSLDYYAAVRSSYYQNRKAAIINDNDNTSMPLPLISIEFE